MNPEDERLLRRNWSFLKQELRVEDFVHRFVDEGIFAPYMRNEILNVIPNTPSMKCEKFLNSVIASGNRGYQAFCNFLCDDQDNRYSRVLEVLDIQRNRPAHQANAAASDSRPSTALSSASSGTVNSETGEKTRRVKNGASNDNNNTQQQQPHPQRHHTADGTPVATVAPVVSASRDQSNSSALSRMPPPAPRREAFTPNVQTPRTESQTSGRRLSISEAAENGRPSAVNEPQSPETSDNSVPVPAPRARNATQSASASNADERADDVAVDMKTLEQELVRIAPTIADLFQKITKQTRSLPTSEDELQKVKDENERLRKTNKSLIEKLNMFQQKIIQLQLDNKRLKENGDIGRVKKDELRQKGLELQEMEHRLDEHKRALEEKEEELNIQLGKLKEIEEENELQKLKIDKLEELQDEGILERNIQQEQISTLVEEKEKQKDQIETLEEHQKMGEQRLFRLEERLKMIEQGPSGRRQGRGRRVVSPPRSNPNPNHWMNGYVERSHNANVKFQSEIQFNPDRESKRNATKKGWPF